MAYKIERYGWRPSLPDFRNVRADIADLPIADEVDPREQMQAPYDQGQLGSCTANAFAGAFEYDAILDGKNFGTPSRLAIYYGERLREGTVDEDSGAYGHDAFKDARKFGVAPEELWPYDIGKFAEEPPAVYELERGSHKIKSYVHPAQTITAMKRLLSNDQTIAFGFTVYESFESQEAADTGIIPMPQRSEQILGGHEVLIVGYLADHDEYALVRNSWGTNWGLGGYMLFPWEYILNAHLSTDFRSIYRPAK